MLQFNIRNIDDLDAFNRINLGLELEKINDCPYIECLITGDELLYKCNVNDKRIDPISLDIICCGDYKFCAYHPKKINKKD